MSARSISCGAVVVFALLALSVALVCASGTSGAAAAAATTPAAGAMPVADAASSAKRATYTAIVTLLPTPGVQPGQVTLSEVATLECSDPATLAKLLTVQLGPAPMAGSTRRMDRGYIALRMRQAKIDPTKVRFGGPDRIVLSLAPAAESANGGTPLIASDVTAAGSGGASSAGAPPQTSEPGVARGRTVSLRVEAGAVVVASAAKALESGAVGASIRVQVAQTGRVIQAVVLDATTVTVSI